MLNHCELVIDPSYENGHEPCIVSIVTEKPLAWADGTPVGDITNQAMQIPTTVYVPLPPIGQPPVKVSISMNLLGICEVSPNPPGNPVLIGPMLQWTKVKANIALIRPATVAWMALEAYRHAMVGWHADSAASDANVRTHNDPLVRPPETDMRA